jgi:hypothetical protein
MDRNETVVTNLHLNCTYKLLFALTGILRNACIHVQSRTKLIVSTIGLSRKMKETFVC